MKIKLKNVEYFNELLLRKGFSKREFGKVLNIGSTYTTQICNGERSISPKIAKKMSETLRVDWDSIFEIVKVTGEAKQA